MYLNFLSAPLELHNFSLLIESRTVNIHIFRVKLTSNHIHDYRSLALKDMNHSVATSKSILRTALIYLILTAEEDKL